MSARASAAWQPLNTVLTPVTKTLPAVSRHGAPREIVTVEKSELKARVNDLQLAGGLLYAATSAGLYSSDDSGRTWTGPRLANTNITGLRLHERLWVALTHRQALVSLDGGLNWYEARLPEYVTGVNGAAIAPAGVLWLATREGAFRSL